MHEIRHALRVLRRSPGFTAIAIVSLAVFLPYQQSRMKTQTDLIREALGTELAFTRLPIAFGVFALCFSRASACMV